MNLGKFYKDIKLLKDQMFYINLFYNFCRFEDSFLRNDIIGLPSKLSFPLF